MMVTFYNFSLCCAWYLLCNKTWSVWVMCLLQLMFKEGKHIKQCFLINIISCRRYTFPRVMNADLHDLHNQPQTLLSMQCMILSEHIAFSVPVHFYWHQYIKNYRCLQDKNYISIYYGGITLLHSVVMHVLTGAFGAEMMAYIGGWRTKQMQHI